MRMVSIQDMQLDWDEDSSGVGVASSVSSSIYFQCWTSCVTGLKDSFEQHNTLLLWS